MINIIKNEFIITKKIILAIFNVFIIAGVALAYFTSTNLVGANIFTESDILDLFFRSTLSMLTPFIVILISKIITDEFNTGGMKIYLINPISRNEVLIGKLVFIFINILITMLVQLLLSFVTVCVLLQIPSVDLMVNITFKYLITLIPLTGLTLTLMIPGFLMNTSRNTILASVVLMGALDIVVSLYTKLSPYSIIYVVQNIAVSNQYLINNTLISLAYIVIGFLFSSYIFSNRAIR